MTTAPTLADRADGITALFLGTPFIAGLLLVTVFAVAWVSRHEKTHLIRRHYDRQFINSLPGRDVDDGGEVHGTRPHGEHR